MSRGFNTRLDNMAFTLVVSWALTLVAVAFIVMCFQAQDARLDDLEAKYDTTLGLIRGAAPGMNAKAVHKASVAASAEFVKAGRLPGVEGK